MTDPNSLDRLCIDTIRTLAIDAVQKAQSGHPGTPMGAAPTAYCLWQRFLRYDPENPNWPNRDRFILSNGHASMLLYSLLFLAGVRSANSADGRGNAGAVTLDDIKTFRQAGSRCPGHPEYGWTSGVEATTGPLGQGLAASVGMAIAGRWQAARFNRPGFPLFDYNVFALCGDGCMMEGLSSEAASLAAHLRLANLCWIYDRNRVTIEGHTDLAFTEDVAARFLSYGWNVVHVGDANDLDRLAWAYRRFLDTRERPTLIVVESHIGFGAPHKHDSPEAHGEPLGPEEVRLAKQFYGWNPDAQFLVPEGVVEHFRGQMGRRGGEARTAWTQLFENYRRQYPGLADEIALMQRRELPEGWDRDLSTYATDAKGISTRDASGQVLNTLARRVPWLIGGAADLAPSTKTRLTFDGAGDFQASSHGGRNFHFGVREHAMCALLNGMALCGIRPYGSSFLVFTDYARGAIRLSALMELPVIHIWTHDSISLGEDGPTHQPVEHIAALRAMPGMTVFRPADANEVVESYRAIMQTPDRPACLILSRQSLPILDRARYASASGTAKGAYILADAPDGKPAVLLLATGSEVALCIAAREQLQAEGIEARVVSMPSWELFEAQSPEYRDHVLPPQVAARVAVEEAASFGWARYAGAGGAVLGLHTFGMSAPLKIVQQHFGFEPAHVVAAAKDQLHAKRRTIV